MKQVRPLIPCTLLLTLLPYWGAAVDYTTTGAGAWNAGNWSPAPPANGPYLGGSTGGAGSDSVIINHAVNYDTSSTYGGGTSGDFDVRGNNTVTINPGGSLTQIGTGAHLRIGDVENGTVFINGGTFNVGTANRLRVGEGGATGTIIVGDGIGAPGSAVLDLDGVLFETGTSAGNSDIVINNDGSVINASGNPHLRIGNQAGTHNFTMNGNGSFSTGTGIGETLIGVRGTTTFTMNGDSVFDANKTYSAQFAQVAGSVANVTLNDNAAFSTRADAFRVGDSGTATITLNNNSSITLDGPGFNSSLVFAIGRVNGASGTININDNASLTSNMPVKVGAAGTGVVNHNGGSFSTGSQWLAVAHSASTARGTYNMNAGDLTVGNVLTVGEAGIGTFNHNGGTVTTAAQLRMGYGAAGSAGTYNLEGGTLRADNIDTTFSGPADTFNWGGGTLTTASNGASGAADFSDPGGFAAGQPLRAGTTLTFDGDLETGFNGGNSTLDLGTLFVNSGVRVNVMTVTGNLDLDTNPVADTLRSVSSAYLLRPNTGTAVDYGEIPLITVGGDLTGEFNTFVAPLTDNIGFTEYTGAWTTGVSGAADLPVNTWYLEYDETADTISFFYKVEGTVPEPGTMGMLALGIVLMRTLRDKGRRRS